MNKPYVLVLYYSRSGSIAQLAQYVARGIAHVDGIEARIRSVPPVSATCEATEKAVPDAGAPYASLEDLRNCAGLALGSPTRFGNMAAPMKYFVDNTTPLWLSGELVDKPACVFSSSASMHGGQESTLLSMMLPLIHQGMIMVGLPYTEAALNTTHTGGTPYGATHVAGVNNDNPLSQDEITLAKRLGERVARVALQMKK
ncbi:MULTISPECIES: NAD(P)H:quinone oxidoreductase [Legionella]|uniref:NAD(P)H:quinone oxidoreductase n=1 Tax=Legionella septentrionalis TaxID=2498109 RepID=A0A3S0WRJ8_9GAMM|nr:MULTISPECIES: NAD(P)H:quinone oxidoreductase [Legionella]MCP0913733.1 NAD(P)H:quinone oxidoreductase [Legionella sp. 27cVA30]RUQ85404.1 NAD(P)H:quinone oxidoreductase [Legionella septentrionalis]RUQ99318.1 NAD(P)H:quinone oxidoreductase [Legionella septentrionalis]RUR09629.1 NAD(P)H:quinone oxidoreductase [Legionella septentrionalis]RUR14795.1 NAD(P)H:quinone oxidoreductase [Legionella septentrionalis]